MWRLTQGQTQQVGSSSRRYHTMPVFVLYLKAEQEGVAKWGNTPGSPWCVSLEEQGEVKEDMFIDPSNEEVNGNLFNFVFRFDGARKQSTVNVLAPNDKKCKGVFKDAGEDAGWWSAEAATKYGDDGFVPVAAFEMRGCELKSWSKAGTRAVVVTEGGTAFEDVELHEDWCEYDEENDASVQLLEVEFKVDTV